MAKKLALILGGNGGNGYAATKRLLEDGMHVCVTYYNNNDNIEKIKNISSKDDLSVYQCNAMEYDRVTKMIADITSNFCKIDVVIFSLTSSLKHSRLLELEWNNYIEHFNLQIKSMHFVTKALQEQILSKQKIKFVILLTEACVGSPPKGLSHYVTSKYAAMGMAKTMAVELAQYGCTVNMVSPGMVETPLLDSLPSKLIEMNAYQNPLKRNAVPDDVSNVISFLASDQSDYINGANIVINGGAAMV